MKLEHLLLSALFLFAINTAEAQRLGKQANQQQHEDMQNEKEIGLMLHQLERTPMKKTPTIRPVVKKPNENKLMVTIYVKADASGGNDGTTWEHAYTDLQAALAATAVGDQIWVAAGTYLPGSADTSTFNLTQDLELYGGFAGTESSIAERDIENNPTILSGDLNGDDVEDDFLTNRGDNVMTVMLIDPTVTTATVVDGFTIQGGQADGDTSQVLEVNGGGAYSFGAAKFENCQFRQNYAEENVGGLYFSDTSIVGVEIINCSFEGNAAGEVAGGLAFVNTSGIISGCLFTGNTALESSGGVYFGADSGEHQVEITNSIFDQNESSPGGALLFDAMGVNNLQMTVSGCDFNNNIAEHGGAIFSQYKDGSTNGSIQIDNCNFNNNIAGNNGGAIFPRYREGSTNGSVLIDNCNFNNNIAEEGGAIYSLSNGDNDFIEIFNSNFTENSSSDDGGAVNINTNANNSTSNFSNCIFENNEGARGGALHLDTEGDNNNNTVVDCDFNNNRTSELSSATPEGGAIRLRFRSGSGNSISSTTINGCNFENNTTTGVGGAIQQWVLGNNYQLTLSDCDFLNNHADVFGGGFRAQSESPSFQMTVEDCLFKENNADIDAGGFEIAQALQAHCDLEIRRTDFIENTSSNEGAGLNFYTEGVATANILIENARFDGNLNDVFGNAVEGAGGFSLCNFGNGVINIDIQSSIFENNTSEDGAGAIQLYKIGTVASDSVNIENCLFTGNSGGTYAGGISLNGDIGLAVKNTTIADNINHVGITVETGTLEIQNTILHNPATGDFFAADISDITSLGGNLVGDDSMNDILIGTDKPNLAPIFMNSGNNPYELAEGSPGIDAGIDAGVTSEFDIIGNMRIQGGRVDIGAYEGPFVSSSKEMIVDNSAMSIFPNPVKDLANIKLENDWTGELTLRMVNALGQEVYSENIEKHTSADKWPIDLSNMPSGVYSISISNGEKIMMRQLVKK